MPINLKALQKRGAEIEIEFYGETGIVEYDPTKFTPAYRAEYNREWKRLNEERKAKLEASRKYEEAKASNDQDEQTEGLLEVIYDLTDTYRVNALMLTRMVRDWEINGLDGNKLPIEADAILQNLPESLVLHIMTEIWSDVNDRGASSGNSRSPSASNLTPISKQVVS